MSGTRFNDKEANRSNDTLTIECSHCHRQRTITLRQVANEETLICECGNAILLVDEDGSIGRMIGQSNK
jgi:hypothetical protein